MDHLSDSSGKVLERSSFFSKIVVCGYENYKCEEKGRLEEGKSQSIAGRKRRGPWIKQALTFPLCLDLYW